MDFEFSNKVQELRHRLLAFMEEHIYPNEARYHADVEQGDRWAPNQVIEELKPKARRPAFGTCFCRQASMAEG